MKTFAAVDDSFLATRIVEASSRITYAAPGVGKLTSEALVGAMSRPEVKVSIILDADEDAYRIGYGDREGLANLLNALKEHDFSVARQQGLRIGVLVCDDEVVVWAPTAQSVEPERAEAQPNGVILRGSAIQSIEAAVGLTGSEPVAKESRTPLSDGTSAGPSSVDTSDSSESHPPDEASPPAADRIADGHTPTPDDESPGTDESGQEIGNQPLPAEELKGVLAGLTKNPPAPFDLSRRTRVFSTKVQYVEPEIQGADWTDRRIKLSSVLLNADLPSDVQAVLDTSFRPFQHLVNLSLPIPGRPLLVHGKPVFLEDRTPVFRSMTQSEILEEWRSIQRQYLLKMRGFGWLIRKDSKTEFKSRTVAFEECLEAWVTAFRQHVTDDEENLVKGLVRAISGRLARSEVGGRYSNEYLVGEVRSGLQGMRIIDPAVRIVYKDVTWESSRDAEFMFELRRVLPVGELESWMSEYSAVREREKVEDQ